MVASLHRQTNWNIWMVVYFIIGLSPFPANFLPKSFYAITVFGYDGIQLWFKLFLLFTITTFLLTLYYALPVFICAFKGNTVEEHIQAIPATCVAWHSDEILPVIQLSLFVMMISFNLLLHAVIVSH